MSTLTSPCCMIVRFGSILTFPAASDTDSARGDALNTALAAMLDYDCLQLAGGSNFQATSFAIPGVTGATILGGGPRSTRITSTRDSTASPGVGFSVGGTTNLSLRGLGFFTTQAAPNFNYTFGAYTSDSAFTGLTGKDLYISGGSDAIYLANAAACDADFFNVELKSQFDTVQMRGGGAHHFRFFNFKMTTTGSTNTGGTPFQSRCINGSNAGTIDLWSGELTATDDGTLGSGASQQVACLDLNALTVNCHSVLFNSSSTSSGITPLDMRVRNSARVNVDQTNVYSRAKTSLASGGSIVYMGDTRSQEIVFVASSTSDVQFNATPLAETEGLITSGGSRFRTLVDLTGYTQFRLVITVPVANASANTPIIYAKYSLDNSTFSPLAVSSNPTVSLASTGICTASAWTNLDPLAISAATYVSLFSSGGDGTINSKLGRTAIEFR